MRLMPSELARSALDAAPDAMLIVDDDGVVRFMNQQVFALFGYARPEIVGHRIEMLLPERFRTRHLDHRARYGAHMRARPMGQNLELYGLRRDGSEFPVEISLSPVVEGEETLVVAAIRDVSDRLRIQKELIASRAVAEEARELADLARQSADRANQGKSRFLATASHDLRQPLQALALLNGTLRRSTHDPLVTEALAQQENAIGAMSRLLNALLDISKLESGAIKPEITDFSLERIFEEMRREFSSVATRKGLTLEATPAHVWVRSDPSLLEQVVRNLVSNAVKYTSSGSVMLRCVPLTESRVRLDITDTGIGIPNDQLALIYEEFYQVGVSTNMSRDGYGLGLSIVKRIIQLLGLRLEVSSQVGCGSTFSLLLPAALCPAAVAQANIPPAQGEEGELSHEQWSARRQLSVLLVEDDPSVRDATRMLLKIEGYHVIAVASTEEALAAIQTDAHLDLLMTDYHLGAHQTGIQVISALRERLGPHLKAILVTGDTSSAIRGLSPDPQLRILSKPIRAEALLRLMREFLTAEELA